SRNEQPYRAGPHGVSSRRVHERSEMHRPLEQPYTGALRFAYAPYIITHGVNLRELTCVRAACSPACRIASVLGAAAAICPLIGLATIVVSSASLAEGRTTTSGATPAP